jgi:hypothetical protein
MRQEYTVDVSRLAIIKDREIWKKKMYFPEHTQKEQETVIPNEECISDHYPIYMELKECAF